VKKFEWTKTRSVYSEHASSPEPLENDTSLRKFELEIRDSSGYNDGYESTEYYNEAKY